MAKEEEPASPMNMHMMGPGPSLLSLPDALIQEIMSGLPLKTVFSCKHTCKRLLGLVSDPEFSLLHLPKSWTTFLYDFPAGCLSLFDPRANQLIVLRAHQCGAKFVNSCNGLLCLLSPLGEVTVCNPILGEFVTLPQLIISNEREVCGVAIGFAANEKRFKVLAITCHGELPRDYEAWIYVIGSDTASWRSVGPTPFEPGHFAFRVIYIDTYVNGAVHWLDTGYPFAIRAFNFESEQFYEFAMPDDPDFFACNIGSVKGCLALTGIRLDALPEEDWIMKDYGAEWSWTNVSRVGAAKRLVGGDGMVAAEERFPSTEIQVVAHVPSLVSLGFIANRENVEIRVRLNDLSQHEKLQISEFSQPIREIEHKLEEEDEQ